MGANIPALCRLAVNAACGRSSIATHVFIEQYPDANRSGLSCPAVHRIAGDHRHRRACPRAWNRRNRAPQLARLRRQPFRSHRRRTIRWRRWHGDSLRAGLCVHRAVARRAAVRRRDLHDARWSDADTVSGQRAVARAEYHRARRTLQRRRSTHSRRARHARDFHRRLRHQQR